MGSVPLADIREPRRLLLCERGREGRLDLGGDLFGRISKLQSDFLYDFWRGKGQ